MEAGTFHEVLRSQVLSRACTVESKTQLSYLSHVPIQVVWHDASPAWPSTSTFQTGPSSFQLEKINCQSRDINKLVLIQYGFYNSTFQCSLTNWIKLITFTSITLVLLIYWGVTQLPPVILLPPEDGAGSASGVSRDGDDANSVSKIIVRV